MNRLLKAQMVLHGDNLNTLSAYLGIAHQTLSRKISGEADFKQKEMEMIRDRYNLSDEMFVRIFTKEGIANEC